jgi:hypothetical protein
LRKSTFGFPFSSSELTFSNYSASVATGRYEAISALSFSGGIQGEDVAVQPGDEALAALAGLYRIYGKALMLSTGLRDQISSSGDDTDFRKAFIASWQQDTEAWEKRWPINSTFSFSRLLKPSAESYTPLTIADAQVQIIFLHTQTILLSLSLQFSGPVLPILEQCQSTALKTVKVVAHKPASSLDYGPSALVIAMAYAATLLLRVRLFSSFRPLATSMLTTPQPD